MKITKDQLEELNKKGKVEVWTGMEGSEHWEVIEVER